MGSIMGLYRDGTGLYWFLTWKLLCSIIGSILGLYWDTGKEHGNHCVVYWGYIASRQLGM